MTDSLTGLFNRKHGWEALVREVSSHRRHHRPLAVLMIDIDQFKLYNDTYGHLAGDEVLRQMATVFRGSLRNEDYACRYGGEEFLVVLPGSNAAIAARVAERMRTVAGALRFGEEPARVTVTISVGVAAAVETDEAESLVRKADAALYRAKDRGRNQVVVFEDDAEPPAGPAPPNPSIVNL